MNLERKFGKELAGSLREETAAKLKQARGMPKFFSELKKIKQLSPEFESFGITEKFEEFRKDIWGRIFKTEKFRSSEVVLNEYLKEFKQYVVEKFEEMSLLKDT